MHSITRKFPKPAFQDLLANYSIEPSSIHACRVIDPTKEAIHTSAARMSEALLLANKIIADRAAITKPSGAKGDGKQLLLGTYGYGRFGNLCPHGIGRGAQDLAGFLNFHWGSKTMAWTSPTNAPAEIQDKTGILVFTKIPGVGGHGHIDLWNKTAALGQVYWNANTIWFWQLE